MIDTTLLHDHLVNFRAEAAKIFHFRDDMEEIARWGARYFLKLLQDKQILTSHGVLYTLDAIGSQLQVTPSFHQQLESLLEILVRLKLIFSPQPRIYQPLETEVVGLEELRLTKRALCYRYPELQANINFLHAVLEKYLLILSGKESFLKTLFSEGSFDVLVDLYKNNPELDYYNRLTACTVAYFVKNLITQGRASISLLEMGAGIGSASQQLLPILKQYRSDKQYHYTDISTAFLSYGQCQFKNFDFLSFYKFDINQEPEAQGLRHHSYDIILAANVIHNASSITKTLTYINLLLRSGGILILNEGTIRSDYSTLIYGLSTGWRGFTDAEWRIPGTPLISLSGWSKLFSVMSFNENLSINNLLNMPEVMSHDVFVAIKR